MIGIERTSARLSAFVSNSIRSRLGTGLRFEFSLFRLAVRGIRACCATSFVHDTRCRSSILQQFRPPRSRSKEHSRVCLKNTPRSRM